MHDTEHEHNPRSVRINVFFLLRKVRVKDQLWRRSARSHRDGSSEEEEKGGSRGESLSLTGFEMIQSCGGNKPSEEKRGGDGPRIHGEVKERGADLRWTDGCAARRGGGGGPTEPLTDSLTD